MANSELDFYLEPDSHAYTLKGTRVPACTVTLELARPSLSAIPQAVLAKATQRGRDVHKAIELYCKKDLDKRTLSQEVKQRLNQWEYFMEHWKVSVPFIEIPQTADPLVRLLLLDKAALVEVPLVHPVWQFGVTPDIGFCYVEGVPSLVEVKATSAHNKATALQTAAQKETINYIFKGFIPPIERRYGVRLTGIGKPDVRLYDQTSDWAMYTSFLNVYNWRAKEDL